MKLIKIHICLLLFLLYCLIFVNTEQILLNNDKLDSNIINYKNILPEGFIPVDENVLNGPITTNREKDNGKKRNLYSMIRNEDDSYYYNYNEFNKLKNETSIQSVYFCEMYSRLRPEVLKGFDLSCPNHYTIVIDKAFYGRYANDTINCKTNFTPEILKKIKNDCGYEPLKNIKYSCEGKSYCSLKPMNSFYKDHCHGVLKYLHIDYHCIKKPELRKEKISIISFYDGIEYNSIYEHSVSEFYQYANIHGYEFQFTNFNYIPESNIFFMKFQTIIDKLIEGLKYGNIDWIFWVDNDVIILNPNIKLETFLPNEKMNKIHLIAAYDYNGRKDYCCGINAGILLIRVHEWSLNVFMRAISYPYYNKNMYLENHDQTSLNNILIEFNEADHYVVVPPHWMNKRDITKGEFLYHIMGGGRKYKDRKLYQFLNKSKNDEEWYTKTNKELRKEVLEYYDLSKEEQIQINIQP